MPPSGILCHHFAVGEALVSADLPTVFTFEGTNAGNLLEGFQRAVR